MKVHPSRLTDRQRIETLDALYTAASVVRGRNAMKLFLRDLLTSGERVMLGRRILIAQLLLADVSYHDIAAQMGVGHDTTRRVHRWLSDQFPGYEDAIKKMRAEMDRRKFKGQNSWSAILRRLKQKYPVHFLLFPWPKKKRTARIR